MSEIEEIRQRDREAIPRFGPDRDPLLRAEMDRRWLLNHVDNLQRWKDEAMQVIDGLQELGRALDIQPGQRITGPAALAAVKRMKEFGADLIRQRREHDVARTQAEADRDRSQRALDALLDERNTWARQLADMRDERDTARKEAETQRDQRISVEVDRDNLNIAIGELIERWEQAPPNLPTRDLRRVIARWEST